MLRGTKVWLVCSCTIFAPYQDKMGARAHCLHPSLLTELEPEGHYKIAIQAALPCEQHYAHNMYMLLCPTHHHSAAQEGAQVYSTTVPLAHARAGDLGWVGKTSHETHGGQLACKTHGTALYRLVQPMRPLQTLYLMGLSCPAAAHASTLPPVG